MRRIFWALLFTALVAACGGNEGANPSVTPSRTPFEPTALPPTWTPSPPGFVAEPTATQETFEPASEAELPTSAVSGQLEGGQEFPPTWTPRPAVQRPTATPRPAQASSSNAAEEGAASSNLPVGSPAPTWTPQPEVCYELQALGSDLRALVGNSVTLSWIPISIYENYLVEVRHPGGSVVHSAVVPGGSYEVPAEVFTQANVYGWEVSAVDAVGNRVCFSISGEIIMAYP